MSTQQQRLDTVRAVLTEARNDDKFAFALEQQLQAVEAKVYRVQYMDLRARKFIPLKSDVPAGAETWAYKVWDVFAEAQWASNYANGIPVAAVRVEKVFGKIEGIISGYTFSTQDLRAAAMAGVALETEEANAAMAAIERKIDKAASLGDAARGFVGVLNHPNPTLLAATASWALSGTATDTILADLMRLAKQMRSDTSEVLSPDTLLLPTAAFDALATRLLNSANSNGATVLSSFLSTNPWVKSVESWPRLNAAGVGSVGRAVCYKKDLDVLGMVVPLEALQHAPQQDALNYKVPIEARFGGGFIRQPKGVIYMDGVS